MEHGIAFLLLIVAGGISGSFTLPMKLARRWSWENSWLLWSGLALVIFPSTTALISVPHLYDIYAAVGGRVIAALILLGLFWGVTQLLFGLAVDAIGVALAFAIVPAMSASLGTFVPLLRTHSDALLERAGLTIMLAITLIFCGVSACALAGRRRHEQPPHRSVGKSQLAKGLALAICSGTGAAMINLGLVFGYPVVEHARRSGVDSFWATNVLWLPVMFAGAIPNMVYCSYLLIRHQTIRRFADGQTIHYYAYAFLMAALWFGSITLYGLAIERLGSWGPVVGWPVFTSLMLVTASAWSLITGEWTHAKRGALWLQLSGVAVLIVAVFTLSVATRWLP